MVSCRTRTSCDRTIQSTRRNTDSTCVYIRFIWRTGRVFKSCGIMYDCFPFLSQWTVDDSNTTFGIWNRASLYRSLLWNLKMCPYWSGLQPTPPSRALQDVGKSRWSLKSGRLAVFAAAPTLQLRDEWARELRGGSHIHNLCKDLTLHEKHIRSTGLHLEMTHWGNSIPQTPSGLLMSLHTACLVPCFDQKLQAPCRPASGDRWRTTAPLGALLDLCAGGRLTHHVWCGSSHHSTHTRGKCVRKNTLCDAKSNTRSRGAVSWEMGLM